MKSAAPTAATLYREREGILPNTLVLAATVLGWTSSFALMGSNVVVLNVLGVVLCVQAMTWAAYLIHEAAHQSVFATTAANRIVGECMNFIAGGSYASFERIKHMHIRHHRDRADLACFDRKDLLRRRPSLRRALERAEWAYVPATEILSHLQVVWRPFFVASQRPYLARSAAMLVIRGTLLAALGTWSLRALLLYGVAYLLLLHVLGFFDAFHHTFDQYFVAASEPVSRQGRDHAYEQANTYSNVMSRRWPWLDWMVLNFGYHNAHHERVAVPWYRLPRLHRELFGDAHRCVIPLSQLFITWHRNRVRRVDSDDYGVPAAEGRRADHFVGAHGVSFLTVV